MNLRGISGKVGRSEDEAGKAITGLAPSAFLEPFEGFCSQQASRLRHELQVLLVSPETSADI